MSAGTLEETIDRHINLGHKDPRLVYESIVAELGDDLLEVAQPHLADLITELVRHRLASQRRREVAKITPATVSNREIMLKSIWIPSEGGIQYKRIADVTANEFDARAAYLDRMVAGIAVHADWCRDCARAIRTAGAANAGELTALPPLPELPNKQLNA